MPAERGYGAGRASGPRRVGSSGMLCVDGHDLARGRRFGQRTPIITQALDVELDGFSDQRFDFHLRFGHGDATRQIGHVRPEACRPPFDDHQILHCSVPHFFKPACFTMLLSVPGGISTLDLPATVTVPGFVE